MKETGAAIAGLAGLSVTGTSLAMSRAIHQAGIPKDMNVVFILSDQHRSDFLGARGVHEQLRTPNLDRLCKNGISFTNAYTSCGLCVPARPALLAGKYPSSVGFPDKRKNTLDDQATIPRHLGAHGYYTGHFGKGHLLGETKENLFGFHERGMRYLYQTDADYAAIAGKDVCQWYLKANVGCHSANDKRCYNSNYIKSKIPGRLHFDTLVVDAVLDFFERNKNRKFYVQVGIEKPHPYWYPPTKFTDAVDPGRIKLPENWRRPLENVPKRRILRQQAEWSTGYLTPDRKPLPGHDGWTVQEAKNAIAAYLACINYVDSEVGRIIAGLKKLGLLEKTLIVYSSDHGDFCQDHGMTQKHCCLEPAINIPMIFYGPGVRKTGLYDKGLAEHADLYPTFCDYLGIPKPAGIFGESLLPTITQGSAPKKQVAYMEYFRNPETAVRSLEYKYIENLDDIDELYDMVNDPQENVNLADKPKYQHVLRDMKTQLANRRKAIGYKEQRQINKR